MNADQLQQKLEALENGGHTDTAEYKHLKEKYRKQRETESKQSIKRWKKNSKKR